MNRKRPLLYALLVFILFVASQLYSVTKGAVQTMAYAEENKRIYLTFDDGPSDRVTPKILDVLKKEGVKATFFIVGKLAQSRKYIVRREYDEGHCVAVHSYSHIYKDIYADEKSLIDDIDKCNDLIYEVTGERADVYRFPGGSFTVDEKCIAAVISHGMKYVDWNASTRDAELVNPTAAQLFKAAVDTPANRQNIVLLSHDTTDKLTTAQALESIIKYYKAKGYSFERF